MSKGVVVGLSAGCLPTGDIHPEGKVRKGVVVTKNDIFKRNACRPTAAAVTGQSAGWLAVANACAINSMAACRADTVTWQVCRYLIDLSGKQFVTYKL